jgi:hypothetical protein
MKYFIHLTPNYNVGRGYSNDILSIGYVSESSSSPSLRDLTRRQYIDICKMLDIDWKVRNKNYYERVLAYKNSSSLYDEIMEKLASYLGEDYLFWL